jgi:HEAT repeat protein
MRSPAYRRFIESMRTDFDRWHDGIPYDLDALAELSNEELLEVEVLLVERKNEDWRDTEALIKIGTPKAIDALERSTRGPNRVVRLRAAAHLFRTGRIASLDDLVAEGLLNAGLFDGALEARGLAIAYPTPAVKAALLQATLCAGDRMGVHHAATTLFVFGKAEGLWDKAYQAFYMRFATDDRVERRKVFDELCAIIGVDGSSVKCVSPA